MATGFGASLRGRKAWRSIAASSADVDCRAALVMTMPAQGLRSRLAGKSRSNYLLLPGSTASAVAPTAEPAMRAVPITALAASPTVPIATEATVSTAVTTAQPGKLQADTPMSAQALRRTRKGGKAVMDDFRVDGAGRLMRQA